MRVMTENGERVLGTERAVSSSQLEMSTTEVGIMEKEAARDFTPGQMETASPVFGEEIR
jgi:hypothetical protein